MEGRIQYLPLDIQNIIREEYPYFARLSKQYYSGEKQLQRLCNKRISKREFINYINIYQPEYFYAYYENDEIYYVLEGSLTEQGYQIKTYIIKIERSKLTEQIILEIETPIYTKNMEDYLLYVDELDYDLVTTYNIVKNLRKICKNGKQFVMKEFDIHLHMNTGPCNLDSLMNKIKTCIYLISNEMIITNKVRLQIFIVPLHITVRNMIFYNEQYGYIDEKLNNTIDYLFMVYNDRLSVVEDYIGQIED